MTPEREKEIREWNRDWNENSPSLVNELLSEIDTLRAEKFKTECESTGYWKDRNILFNELGQVRDEYQNLCKFAIDYENENVVLRAENDKLKDQSGSPKWIGTVAEQNNIISQLREEIDSAKHKSRLMSAEEHARGKEMRIDWEASFNALQEDHAEIMRERDQLKEKLAVAVKQSEVDQNEAMNMAMEVSRLRAENKGLETQEDETNELWRSCRVQRDEAREKLAVAVGALTNITITQCPHFAEIKETCTCVFDEAFIALNKIQGPEPTHEWTRILREDGENS